MWLISNKTPYAAERSWIQDKDANKIWIVVVKATFDILPNGKTRLADQQVPVFSVAKPWGEMGKSSLQYEADLLALRGFTDVLVNGAAWAPEGKKVASIDVELTLGSIQKRLRVFGDRVWRRSFGGASISEPESFESMPIVYERAFGGWDKSGSDPAEHRLESRNPVGTGFSERSENCIGKKLPNIERPGQLIGSWNDRPEPAGFNAIDCAWSPRRELAGTYDAAWQQTRFPLWAEDFDPRYGNCAPRDQQAHGFLRGGETVNLVNLSPTGSVNVTLPRVYPFFQTRFGRERVEHRAQLSTVILEPSALRIILAWQTSIVCNHRADELDMTVVTEKRMLS